MCACLQTKRLASAALIRPAEFVPIRAATSRRRPQSIDRNIMRRPNRRSWKLSTGVAKVSPSVAKASPSVAKVSPKCRQSASARRRASPNGLSVAKMPPIVAK
eukprot:gene6274-biopygen7839